MNIKKTLLVVGGCGYIGSHMVKKLLEAGHHPVVLDDLSSGFRESLLGGELIVGDCGNRESLDQLFSTYSFDGVLHFASLIQAGESMNQPDRYYQVNFLNTQALLDAMCAHSVNTFVFSSSAAVYGHPERVPIDEQHPCNPINPYGNSKKLVELLLPDYVRAYGLKTVSLRYFNAAGADPEARIGEQHPDESHLIPLALQAIINPEKSLPVFGDDYDTPDGTCIRDYIHVEDLVDAHLLALEYLWNGGKPDFFNLGYGTGYSVKQILDMIKKVTGATVPAHIAGRRAGDTPVLIANADRARKTLNWQPRYADLETIIRHAWAWEQKRTGHIPSPTQ